MRGIPHGWLLGRADLVGNTFSMRLAKIEHNTACEMIM